MVKKEEVISALSRVIDPELGRDVVTLGMIEGVEVQEEGRVTLTLNLTTPACPLRDRLEKETKDAIYSLKGVEEVILKVSSKIFSTRNDSKELLPGVKNIIAVASGKGGVGKSTIAVNLACSLSLTEAEVGLLDADAYGPNIPKMMGIDQQLKSENGLIIPPVANNIKVMSLGFIYRGETPVIWRGPLISGALKQMLGQVDWGELDYLVVDLPPGTGDIPLTLAQNVPLGGVVVVTTPQEAAVSIAAKSISMFRRLQIPIIGIVENMSYLKCSKCGEKMYPFSSGGGREMASRMKENFLGEVPISERIREASDLGKPVVIFSPDSEEAIALKQIALKTAGIVSIIAYSRMAI
jgi:ATP-binding protein involved in chromosome partitioning